MIRRTARQIIKLVALILTLTLLFATLTSCEARRLGFGSQKITDPLEYGDFGVIDAPAFFPEKTEGFTVNSYAFTLELYFETCYELFLDLTVSREQLDKLLARARVQAGFKYEETSFYNTSYREIVYSDYYVEGVTDDSTGERSVGYALIEKVIFNEATGNIIYVSFVANDWGVYSLSDVEYFNRFKIDEKEYVEHLNDDKYGI